MHNRGVIVVLLLATGALCQAQTQSTQPKSMGGDDAPRDAVWTSNLGNEPVGPGDLLYISVSGAPELSRSYRVSPDGSIVLPMGHNSIHVAGLTPDAIGKTVAADLTHENVLVSPIVSVSMLDYRSRQVTVVGAVKQPGMIQAIGEVRVLDALAKAQGVAPEAGPEIVVTRPAHDSVAAQVTTIPLKQLLSGQHPELDLRLYGGEEVRVPEAQKIFIVGNVKMPGSYPVNDAEGTTVLKALAMSQGQMVFTTKSAYIYRTVDGKRDEIAVPLHKILHRSAPDMVLQANDILYVPENGGLHLTTSVLDRIASFGGNVGSGLIIWH
jgi:polysaccharide export outer membrane protein